MRKYTHPKSILILAVIGFTVSIAVGLNELYRQRSAIEAEHKINAWLMAQTELEMQRLVHTLDRYVSDVGPSSHDDLMMRFDIFWSRLPLLLVGQQSQALRQIAGFDETIRGIEEDLEAVEDDVLSLKSHDITVYYAIRDRLIANMGPLHDLVLAATDQDSAKIEEERQDVRRSYWQVTLSIFGTFVGGAVFIVFLFRETQRAQRLLRAATEAKDDARNARAQLSQAIESISEGFVLYGPDRKLMVANRKLGEMYSKVDDLIVPGADFEQICKEAISRGQFAGSTDPVEFDQADLFNYAAEGEHTAELADGRWIRTTRRMMADGGCVSVHSDITELKQRERELAVKSQQLQATLDNISQGIGVFDGERRLTTRNGQFVRLLDLPPELGDERQELDAILQFQADRGDFGAAGSDEDTSPVAQLDSRRFELNLPDGRAIEVHSNAMPDGGLVITYSDISERRFIENERRLLLDGMHQSQKMQAIGTLAGGIAHDFNNVLASILGNAELALYDLDETHPAREAVLQISGAGEHAANVVKQILAFSRHYSAEAEPIQVDQVVNESLKLLRATLPATIDLIVNRRCDHTVVVGDATQINQVIMNLGVNASHAIGANPGTITVDLEAVEIDGGFAEGLAAEKKDATGQPIRVVADADELGAKLWSGLLTAGPHLRLTVRDTGCGISYQTMTRMFEPFFTTKEVGSGTGLGLSAVHGIVMRHHGALIVDSRIGAGTSFTILLPQGIDTPAPRSASRPAESGGQGHERILIIDDEPLVLQPACRMLGRAGFRVDGMDSSLAALEAFRADPYRWHLVITDQTMPKMTGIMLAEEMLRIRPDLPILLCTGYSATVGEQRAMEVGIRAFAHKPLVGQALTDLVRRVLDATKIPEVA